MVLQERIDYLTTISATINARLNELIALHHHLVHRPKFVSSSLAHFSHVKGWRVGQRGVAFGHDICQRYDLLLDPS